MTANAENIENLREQNQCLQQRLCGYERLYSVLQMLGSARQVDDIVQHVIDEAMSLCRAQEGAIMLFGPNRQETAKTLIRNAGTGDKRLDHYLNNLLAGWIAKHQRPLLTNKLHEIFSPENLPAKYRDIASLLSIPLEWKETKLGVMHLASFTREQTFGEWELSLMEILASQCAQFIANARLNEKLFAENLRLRQEVQDKYAFHGLIGHSPKMQELFALLERVIPTEGRVLLEGESGTGKERVARIIHYNGPRQTGPFVAVDCGALPANLLESELFGYTKGAFTGALRDKKGLFEAAESGTLFLDEIVNISLEIQSKFLRAIQEGEIRPLGDTQARKVDVRIIAAASGNLRTEVAAGRFRQDLFYRLHVVNIALPPLRERKEDIARLANHFLYTLAAKYGKKISGFKPEAMIYLEGYNWPGNVRELEHIVERMVILAEPDLELLTPELLPLEIHLDNAEAIPEAQASEGVKTMKDAYEKMILLEVLNKQDWNQSATAKALGIHESTVRYKMQKYGIKKSPS